MEKINLVFICQVVDINDPIMATTIRWIKVFSQRNEVNRVHVLSLRSGVYDFPDNVEVHVFGRDTKAQTIIRFYSTIIRCLRAGEIHSFFIYQGGVYPLLLLPFRLLMNKQIYQWKAHPVVSLPMKFYALFCDTKIFTSTAKAFPFYLAKVKVLGQGVDIDKFSLQECEKTYDLICVGRISPSKRIEFLIDCVKYIRDFYGISYRLHLIGGPSTAVDKEYIVELRLQVEKDNLNDLVFFVGAVSQGDLPDYYNRARVFISASETALDRAVVEAMSCGVPVVTANECFADILDEQLKHDLYVEGVGIEVFASLLKNVMEKERGELYEINLKLRRLIEVDHSDERLIGEMLVEMGI